MYGYSSVRDNCGIALAHSIEDTLSLQGAQENRGQELKGIGALADSSVNVAKWKGNAKDFPSGKIEHGFLAGELYGGHDRYSTSGPKSNGLMDGHPHCFGWEELFSDDDLILGRGEAAVFHNGTIENYARLRDEIEASGMKLQTWVDSEGIIYFHALGGLENFMKRYHAAYSAIILDPNLIVDGVKGWGVVFRDRHGLRPAWIGKKNGKYIVASEDSAIRKIGGFPVREVKPGEAVYIKDDVYLPKQVVAPEDTGFCFFEFNYFSRPDSHFLGKSVHDARFRLGMQLAREYAPDVDIVTWVPNCPEPHAYGYCFELGIEEKLAEVFGKIKYEERSFIQSTQEGREASIKSNLYLLVPKEAINRRRVLVIDDSIVRGTNGKVAIDILKDAGASWVGFASATPPIGGLQNGEYRWCPYGVDMPVFDRFALVNYGGNGHTYGEKIEGIRQHMGADSLYYISYNGLYSSLALPEKSLCSYCIGGRNPVKGFKPVNGFSS